MFIGCGPSPVRLSAAFDNSRVPALVNRADRVPNRNFVPVRSYAENLALTSQVKVPLPIPLVVGLAWIKALSEHRGRAYCLGGSPKNGL